MAPDSRRTYFFRQALHIRPGSIGAIVSTGIPRSAGSDKWRVPVDSKDKETEMAEVDKNSELIGIEQLAQRLGITVRHVRRLVAEKRVPYYKVGRLVRFHPAEITAWLDARRVAGPQPA
jgi:excisionase family DNA binding protein